MKLIFGIVVILLTAQSQDDAEKARKYLEDYLSANPDVASKVAEGLLKDKKGDRELKVGAPVDISSAGERFEGDAGVDAARHDVSGDKMSAGGRSGLVAPSYPDSAPVVYADEDNQDRRWKIADAGQGFSGETRSYLSKDSLDTVRAYYDKEVGKMQSGSLSYLTAPEGMRANQDRPEPYIYAYPVDRTAHMGLIGLEIRALKPIEDHFIRYPIVGPIFERLNYGVGSGDTSKEKFDSLVDEYKHLAWMYYPVSEQRSGKGKLLSKDEVVFDGCKKEAGGGMSAEEMQAKMQQLMAEGKMQEMLQLSEKLMGPAAWATKIFGSIA